MSKSHGMSPEEYARFLFDQEFARCSPREKRAFLVDHIDAFTERVTYSRRSEQVGHDELVGAVHAAELFLQGVRDVEKKLSPTDKYRVDKLLESISAASKLIDEKISLDRINNLLKELEVRPKVEATPAPVTNMPIPPKPSNQVSTRSPFENDRETRIEIRSRENKPGSLAIVIFPAKRGDSPYAVALKSAVRKLVSRDTQLQSSQVVANLLNHFKDQVKPEGRIEADVLMGIKTAVGQLGEIFMGPSRYAQQAVSTHHFRKSAIGFLSNTFRSIEASPFSIEEVCPPGSKQANLFTSDDFMKIAADNLADLINFPSTRNRSFAWNVRKIAQSFDNEQLETLAGIAYLYDSCTNPSAPSCKAKFAKVVDEDRVGRISGMLMDRKAVGDKTWRDIANETLSLSQNRGNTTGPRLGD